MGTGSLCVLVQWHNMQKKHVIPPTFHCASSAKIATFISNNNLFSAEQGSLKLKSQFD
jgi:hypothetical protein